MPHRPESHSIGDIGESQVAQVFLSCGWACDKVQTDYGEDLIVQPTLNENVDPFRLLVQVKSTKNLSSFRSKTYGYSLLIPLDLAIKWCRSDNIVIVVIWDINKQMGLWACPEQQIDEYRAYTHNTPKVRISFDKSNEFSAASITKFVWEARINHYNRLITFLTSQIEEALELEIDVNDIQSQLYTTLFDFFRDVGIIRDGLIDNEFRQWIQHGINRIAVDYPGDSPEEIAMKAGTLALLVWVDKNILKCGLPYSLLQEGGLFAIRWIDAIDRLEKT